MTFVFPNVMLSSSMFLAYVIYRLYFSEIYKEVYLNAIMKTCMYHVRERGFVRLLVFFKLKTDFVFMLSYECFVCVIVLLCVFH